jgi:hypothetical protein
MPNINRRMCMYLCMTISFMSLLLDLIPEVISGQKYRTHVYLILNGYRAVDVSCCSFGAHARIDKYKTTCMSRWIDYRLFIYAVSTAALIEHRMIWENDHVRGTWKGWQKAVVLYSKARSQHSPGGSEVNYEKP